MRWFTVKNFEGYYEISDCLRVRNARNLRVLPVNSGKVTLCKDGVVARIRPCDLTSSVEVLENKEPVVPGYRKKHNSFSERMATYPWFKDQHAPSLLVGDAGEALVCSELLIRGVRASYNVMAGAPYDIIADFGDSGRMFTVQVKSTSGPRIEQARNERYSFSVPSTSKCDLFAYVALDTKTVVMERPSVVPKHERSFSCLDFIRDSEDSIDEALHYVYRQLNFPDWLK